MSGSVAGTDAALHRRGVAESLEESSVEPDEELDEKPTCTALLSQVAGNEICLEASLQHAHPVV